MNVQGGFVLRRLRHRPAGPHASLPQTALSNCHLLVLDVAVRDGLVWRGNLFLWAFVFWHFLLVVVVGRCSLYFQRPFSQESR